MAPPISRSASTSSAPPMRQSCDRCHKQKLRCTRSSNNNTGACDRCLPKRVPCVYSSSLPKGRPSLYRFNNDTSPQKVSRPSESPQSLPITPPASVTSATPMTHGQKGFNPTAVAASADMNSILDSHTNHNLLFPMSDGEGLMDISPDTWQYLEGLGYENMKLGEDFQSEDAMFNWQALMHPQQNMADFSGSLNSMGSGEPQYDYGVQGHPGFMEYQQDFFSQPHHGYGNAASYMERCNSNMKDNDSVISELARLSVHVSSLCRSSSNLAELSDMTQQKVQSLQRNLNDATFDSVAAWLSHGANAQNLKSPADYLNTGFSPMPNSNSESTGGILSAIFSASQHFLEVILPLQSSGAMSISASSELSDSRSLSSTSSPPPLSYPSTPSQGSLDNCNNTICDLIVTCHIMILNAYAAVLVSLDREADHRPQSMKAIGDIR